MSDHDAGSWDYIVVGAGSAGAVVAAHLSETRTARVLLLEAGPDYRAADTPQAVTGRWDYGQIVERHPELWWTELRARRTAAQEPREYGRGKGVGGSSSVNGLFAIRGTPEDFDLWELMGVEGWGFADVLPSFRAIESDLDFPDADYHGNDGPIPIVREPEQAWRRLDVALRDAALSAGYGWAPDYNAPAATGASPFAFNKRDGRRVSTNDAYLEPARERENLVIRGGHLVDVVLIDGRGMRARGVRTADGEEHLLERGGEVILSAGAIHSPAILMRSGVGPANCLNRAGIPVLEELPVGRVLQEHPMLTVTFPVLDDVAAEESQTPMVCVRYSSGVAGGGPNDMMILSGGGYKARQQHLSNGGAAGLAGGLRIWVMQSFSTGTLEIVSPDPTKDPHVELGLLTDSRDHDRLVDGVERATELIAQPALAELVTGDLVAPPPREMAAHVGDGYSGHVCATCPMGSPSEGTTVLDADCRVLGVDGLRVIDASSMPLVPRSNTHLSVLMLAEHAARRLVRSSEQHASQVTRGRSQ